MKRVDFEENGPKHKYMTAIGVLPMVDDSSVSDDIVTGLISKNYTMADQDGA